MSPKTRTAASTDLGAESFRISYFAAWPPIVRDRMARPQAAIQSASAVVPTRRSTRNSLTTAGYFSLTVSHRLWCLSFTVEKIKVAPQMSLGHMSDVQSAEAALVTRRLRFPCRAPSCQLISVHVQIKFAIRDTQFDQVSIAHKLKRATYERFGRHV